MLGVMRLSFIVTGFAVLNLAAAARADLTITLSPSTVGVAASATASPPAPATTATAAKAAASKPSAPAKASKVPAPAPIRGGLASRSLPSAARQIGVVRRGGTPVLPPVSALTTPSVPASPPAEMAIKAFLGRAKFNANIFRMPDPQSQWLGGLLPGQTVAIVSQWQGWWSIVMGDGSQGYVPQSHVELLPFEVRSVRPSEGTGQQQSVAEPQPVQGSADQVMASPAAQALIKEAYDYLGTPYVWGGNTKKGLDCSGLVKNCFKSLGIQLPRRASEQARVGMEVPFDQLQPGDRLYFSVKKEYDHTGIYLGDGYFIHASRSRNKVAVDHLSTALYARSLSAARR